MATTVIVGRPVIGKAAFAAVSRNMSRKTLQAITVSKASDGEPNTARKTDETGETASIAATSVRPIVVLHPENEYRIRQASKVI